MSRVALTAAVAVPVVLSSVALLASWQYKKRRELEQLRESRSMAMFPNPFHELEHLELTGHEGIRLHAVAAGPVSGPLMLFLHGFPEFWFSWRHQLKEFSNAGYRAVALDMRGYNDSDKPQGVSSYGLEVLAADVAAVIKDLGSDKCVLVGHDWGGIVAWAVAAAHPQLVDKLVILAAPHPALVCRQISGDRAQLLRSWYVFMFQLPYLPELMMTADDCTVIQSALSSAHGGPLSKGAVTPVDVERYKQAFQKPGAATAAINYYRALFREFLPWKSQTSPAFAAALNRPIHMPVLVLWAGRDAALGTGMLQDMEKLAPQVSKHVIADCAHMMQVDQPSCVNRMITFFLMSH